MKKLLYASLAASALLAAAPAWAQVTLTAGNNDPVAIHADPGRDQSNTTVYGLTVDNSTSVAWTSDTMLETNGSGFAILEDNTPVDALTFDNLLIQLELGGSFTEYEFSAEFAIGGNDPNAYLDIFYTLVGGGTGSFNYLTPGCAICPELEFSNAGLKDFRIFSGAGPAFQSLYLTTTGHALDKVKQNEILVSVAPVPEPSTWAMMLLGFGAAGFSMRRTRKTRGLLRAIA